MHKESPATIDGSMSQGEQEVAFGENTPRPAWKLSPVAKYKILVEGFGSAGARAEKID
jgi:hypothetical protein